jgi:cell wall assembly regulator SMI1
VNVDIDPLVRETAARLGAGVPYALKAVAGLLADDPDLGRPSDVPGVLTVTLDGGMVEDCPPLAIGYIREPDRVEIRFVSTVGPPEPAGPAQDGNQGAVRARSADPATDALVVREVADAWHRVTRRLRQHAPASYAALRAGTTPAAVAALEDALGVRIPVELHVLWLLTAGDDGVDGRGCLPGGAALLPLDAVAALHRQRTDAQARQDALDAGRDAEDRVTVWRATWIPVAAHGTADRTSGLYLDAATGHLGRWSRYAEPPGEELDTLVTYLEGVADLLETPALATEDRPGSIGGALVWLSSVSPSQETRWRPLTG